MHYSLFNTQLRLICNRANEQPGVIMDNTVFLGGLLADPASAEGALNTTLQADGT